MKWPDDYVNKVICGDCLEVMKGIPDGKVQTCITSPPYWGLRDYGVVGQLGLEKTPEEYVEKMVELFREVRRVLRDDGTLWINLGDSYAGSWGNYGGQNRGHGEQREIIKGSSAPSAQGNYLPPTARVPGLKPKDLVGIPWMVAFALRADGWYLRCDIIWSKPNPMPESVTDRPTKSHEYIFLMSKRGKKYYYDAAAIRSPLKESSVSRLSQEVNQQQGSSRANGGEKSNGPMKAVARRTDKQRGHRRRHAGFNDRWDSMTKEEQQSSGANKRSVWEVATRSFSEAHFATYPTKLIDPCILAGSKEGDIVLDPFGGAGTTALRAKELGRRYIHIDLTYYDMARRRLGQGELFNQGTS